jgi:PqqD family protein of HPr-rel-A system
VWRLKITPTAPVLSWDGESCVLLSQTSGDTHLLNLVERTALQIFADHSPIDLARLSSLLCARLDIENDSDVQKYLAQMVIQFDELGLIEPA